MANMKEWMTFGLLSLLFLASPAFAEEVDSPQASVDSQQASVEYPQAIINECAALNNMGEPGCENDNSVPERFCFADKRSVNEKDIKKRDQFGLQAAPGIYCYAYYEHHSCGTLFQVLKEGNPASVTCEEMLTAVANKNAECGNCLKKVSPGVPGMNLNDEAVDGEQAGDSPSGEQAENTADGEQSGGE